MCKKMTLLLYFYFKKGYFLLQLNKLFKGQALFVLHTILHCLYKRKNYAQLSFDLYNKFGLVNCDGVCGIQIVKEVPPFADHFALCGQARR